MPRECASAELRNFESHGGLRHLKATIDLLLSLISEVYEGLVSDSKEASITNFRLSTHSFASLTKVGCGILSQGMCVTDATPIAAELHHHAIDSGFPPLVSFGQQRSGCAYA
jgi:hypothetical protein